MQQLTLQFDGYAPIGQSVDASAAKERNVNSNQSVGFSVGNVLFLVRKLVVSRKETLRLYASASLCVAMAFGIMFVSAIIGG